MTVITFVLRDGESRAIDAEDGLTVMEIAVNAGVRGIAADCGGECQCATCHVYVDERYLARITPPGDTERDMLEGVAAPLEKGSRLSCQISVSPTIEGVVIRVPETQ